MKVVTDHGDAYNFMSPHEELLASLALVPNLKQRELIIWGSGAMARELFHVCAMLGSGVGYFIDGTDEHAGEEIFGAKVLGADEGIARRSPQSLIVVASMWWREIGVDLINRGLEFPRDFILAQRSTSSTKWAADARDAIPLFIGRHSREFDKGFLHFFQFVRPRFIGAFCSISATAQIVPNHRKDAITTHPFPYNSFDGMTDIEARDGYAAFNPALSIGNDVWFGADAKILPGISIGNGAIIGANAVVTRNVPAYAIMAGSPARIVRYRFAEDKIALLEAVKWWTWPDRRIKAHLAAFTNPDQFFSLAESVLSGKIS